MPETVVTSSVLIVVLILLRYLFRGKMNLRLQYALWLLAAVRLLMPLPISESPLSLLNLVDRNRQANPLESSAAWARPDSPLYTGAGIAEGPAGLAGDPKTPGEAAGSDISPKERAPLSRILYTAWLMGAVATGLWFISQNIWFYKKLRKTRKTAKAVNSKLTVYLSPYVKSPCLFGLRPSIYIHTDNLTDDRSLRYILAHEETHYRHGDHLWAYLRCLCLALHWFNPLVWWAALLSRRDCEIACDESTLIRIGDEHRKAYGNMLIHMIEGRAKPSDLLLGATTMTSGKSGIKERITIIAQKPKMGAYTLAAVALVMAVTAGCTFTGAKTTGTEETVLLSEAEIEQYNKVLEPLITDAQGNTAVNPLSHFLTSYYDRPEDIDLAECLRYFPAENDVTDEAEFEALKSAGNWPFGADMTLERMPVPIHKYPSDAVNETLQKYAGVALNDLSGAGADELIYLKEYDAYYNFTSDFAAGVFVCTSGERQGDIVRLYGKHATLTLKKQGDGFLFVSHRRAGPAQEPVPPAAAAPADPRQQIFDYIAQRMDLAYAPYYTDMHHEMNGYEETINGSDYTGTFLWTRYFTSTVYYDVPSDIGKEQQVNYSFRATAKISPDGALDPDSIVVLDDASATGPPQYVTPLEDFFKNLPPVDISATGRGTDDLDRALSQALLQKNQGRYYRGECIGEGHIILGKEEKSGVTTVYALTMYGEYGFENKNFVKVSGSGVIPAVFTFESSQNGLACTGLEEPEDGARYGESIRRLFPPEYRDGALSHSDSDAQDLKSQERAYAASYLKKIGRKAPIGDYGDFEHTLLTEAGVSVEVSNGINDKLYASYPMWIGTREALENGIRYVYELSYNEKEREIVFKKYEYDTNRVVESTRLDSVTGSQLPG